MDSSEQQIIQNSEIAIPGWVLFTLLQHLEVSWDSKSLTIPQSEVAINSYRLGSRLLREAIDSEKSESGNTGDVTGETVILQEKPNSSRTKKRKPKK